MTDSDFIKQIIELYQKARLTTYQIENIKRCKNRSISGFAEDLFAFYISGQVDKKNLILIEPEIYFKRHNKTKKICPDISISVNNEIKQLWDLKMDLGFKRDNFIKFCEDKDVLIKELRSNYAKINGENFVFSDKLTFNIVIVSDKNISKSKSKQNVDELKNIENVNIFYLTSGKHPNNKDIPAYKLPEAINATSDFEKLRQIIINLA
jgi:hypothetical protein